MAGADIDVTDEAVRPTGSRPARKVTIVAGREHAVEAQACRRTRNRLVGQLGRAVRVASSYLPVRCVESTLASLRSNAARSD